jgi:Ca2+-transporting ATPase
VLAVEPGLPETDARSLTFVSLVLVDLGLVLVNRSFATSLAELIGKANRALVWVTAVTVALLALVLISPVGRALFRFGPLHADDLTLVVLIVVSVFATLEFLKRFWRTRLVA